MSIPDFYRRQLRHALGLAQAIDDELEALDTARVPAPIHLLRCHDTVERTFLEADTKVYLDRITSAYSTCQELIMRFNDISDGLRGMGNSWKHNITTIHSLPPEILCMIFEMACLGPSKSIRSSLDVLHDRHPPQQRQAISLALVCSRWKDIMYDAEASLFSKWTISADDPFASIDQCPHLVKAAHCAQTQSHALLDLEIVPIEPKIYLIQDAQPTISQRLRSLTVDYPLGYLRFFRQARSAHGQVAPDLEVSHLFPNLEHLHVTCARSSMAAVSNLVPMAPLDVSMCEEFLELPRLSALSFSNCIFPVGWFDDYITLGGATRLQKLTLKGLMMSPGDLANIIEACSGALNELTLEEISCPPPFPIITPGGANVISIAPVRARLWPTSYGNGSQNSEGPTTATPPSALVSLTVINCSARFTRGVLFAAPSSLVCALRHFHLDLGSVDLSYAELHDQFKAAELDGVYHDEDWGIDGLLYGDAFHRMRESGGHGTDTSTLDFGTEPTLRWRREEIEREWGTVWLMCKEPIEEFLASTPHLESLFIRGPTGIMTHFLEKLESSRTRWFTTAARTDPLRAEMRTLTQASRSSPSTSRAKVSALKDLSPSPASSMSSISRSRRSRLPRHAVVMSGYDLPPLCPNLHTIDLRLPEHHRRTFTLEDLAPLHRALRRVLDRGGMPILCEQEMNSGSLTATTSRPRGISDSSLEIQEGSIPGLHWIKMTTVNRKLPLGSSVAATPAHMQAGGVPTRFLRVTIPACFPEEWNETLKPLNSTSSTSASGDGTRTDRRKKHFVVDRMTEDCKFHRKMEESLPALSPRPSTGGASVNAPKVIISEKQDASHGGSTTPRSPDIDAGEDVGMSLGTAGGGKELQNEPEMTREPRFPPGFGPYDHELDRLASPSATEAEANSGY